MPAFKSLFKPFRKSQDESMSGPNKMAMPAEPKSSMNTEESMSHSPNDTQTMTTTTTAATNPSSQPTVVIELFQSQGCSSCPPANTNAIDLACARGGDPSALSSGVQKVLASAGVGADADVLLLTYHVTYWDYIGWRDTFGAKACDERQRDYVRRMRLRSAFTPQIIANGRASGVGSSKSDLARILRDGAVGADVGRAAVRIAVDAGARAATVGCGGAGAAGLAGGPLDVLLVYYDPAPQDVKISRGENRGRTLPHLNIVTDMQRIGQVQVGREQVFDLKEPPKGLRAALLVQDGPGGPVLSAARI